MVFTLHWSSSLGLSSFLARALRSSRAAVRGVLSAASRNWSTWLSRWVATESGHGCWSILSLEANFIASTPHSYAYIKQARCSLIIITEAAATTQHPAECEREKVKIIYIPASLAPFYSQKTLVSPPSRVKTGLAWYTGRIYYTIIIMAPSRGRFQFYSRSCVILFFLFFSLMEPFYFLYLFNSRLGRHLLVA